MWTGSPVESGPTTPLPDKKLLLFILDRLQKYVLCYSLVSCISRFMWFHYCVCWFFWSLFKTLEGRILMEFTLTRLILRRWLSLFVDVFILLMLRDSVCLICVFFTASWLFWDY